jgi:hypothetical protein
MITTDDPGPRVLLFVLALESKTPGIARLFLDRGDTAYDKLMRASWLVRDGQWSALRVVGRVQISARQLFRIALIIASRRSARPRGMPTAGA